MSYSLLQDLKIYRFLRARGRPGPLSLFPGLGGHHKTSRFPHKYSNISIYRSLGCSKTSNCHTPCSKTSKYLDSFAREAVQDHWLVFPGLRGPPEMDHFGTLGTTKHTLSHPTASGHPICTPGRPKRSIVPTWAPKTLPKWSPKRCQVDKCRPSRNMRRRERIACLPPLGELRFRSFFRVRKMSLNIC